MSRTIKITNLNQAEDIINRQNNQINRLNAQLSQVETNARLEAQRAAATQISTERAAMNARLNQSINNLNNKMQREIDAEKRERLRVDLEHRKLLQKQENDFYARLEKEKTVVQQKLQQQSNDFNKRINETRDWTRGLVNDLQKEISETRDWTGNLIRDLNTKVNESFKEQQKEIDKVRNRIDNLYEKDANDRTKANKLIADIIERAQTADRNLLHRKFAPGRLSQIERAINNIKTDDPAATNIATVRNITNDLFILEDDVRKGQQIFNALHNHVLTEAAAVLKIMAGNRNIHPKDEKNEIIKDEQGNAITLEVDYWTNGKYSKLEKELKSLEKELVEKKDSIELTVDRLHNIFDRIIAIRNEQNDLVIETLKQGNASEERVKISEDLINAMLEQGFDLKKVTDEEPAHNYLGGDTATDAREGVFAILKHGGTEITIVVNTDEKFCHQVVFQRNDELPRNEAEFRQGLEEIKRILEKGTGIKMGELQIPAGGDVKQVELTDPIALAKAGGINKELKKRLGFAKR
jgi:hypothetical protein